MLQIGTFLGKVFVVLKTVEIAMFCAWFCIASGPKTWRPRILIEITLRFVRNMTVVRGHKCRVLGRNCVV